MSTFSKLWIKLRNKAYRDAFVATQLKRGIPFQFRVTRKKLGLSQADVARLAGVSQGVISRAEDSDYGNLTFNNVLRIAAGLDVAFVGRLVPFSDLARWFDNLSEESVQVPTFEQEDQGLEAGTTAFQPALGNIHRMQPSPGDGGLIGGTAGQSSAYVGPARSVDLSQSAAVAGDVTIALTGVGATGSVGAVAAQVHEKLVYLEDYKATQSTGVRGLNTGDMAQASCSGAESTLKVLRG